jgi:hypothetical protein
MELKQRIELFLINITQDEKHLEFVVFFNMLSICIGMKMLISNIELGSRGSRDNIPLECIQCGKTHYRTKNTILRVLNGNLKNTLKGCFCSKECKNIHRTTSKVYSCKQCGTEINKVPSALKKVKNVFCSSSCSAKYNNIRKPVIHNICIECNSHFKPIRSNRYTKYCSKECKMKYQLKKYILLIESGNYKCTRGGNPILKKYLINNRGYCCEECKLSIWRNEKIKLTVHHIDGDASNNLPSNLQLLCWNCHSMTNTYGKRNHTSTRKYRYI